MKWNSNNNITKGKAWYVFLLCSILTCSFSSVLAQTEKRQYVVNVYNSIGEPQQGIFLKVGSYGQEYNIDDKGVISFEYNVPTSYAPTAYLYFKFDKDKIVKTFRLEKDSTNYTFYINSKYDIQRFKQENKAIGIEGILQDMHGNPIEKASICLQGTGKSTLSDEIGLFSLEADYNHPIIVRASGMETKTLGIGEFLRNENEALTIVLNEKNPEKIYTIVDKMPEYRGGRKRFMEYLERKTQYSDKMKQTGVEGVVVMQFVVEKNGHITHPELVRTLHPLMDTIAYKAIKDMPSWVPGSDGGRRVRCRYSMPISFKIPVPKLLPEKNIALNDSLDADTIQKKEQLADSLRQMIVKDSVLIADTMRTVVTDSFLSDSVEINTSMVDSLVTDTLTVDSTKVVTTQNKVKKRPNAFIRFFRRLFGIKREYRAGRNRKDKQNMMTEKVENNNVKDDLHVNEIQETQTLNEK